MANDSDADDYGEEWEEQEESETESDGQEELSVHPLPKEVKLATNPAHSGKPTKAIGVERESELLRGVLSGNDTASDSGESTTSGHSAANVVSFPESVVKLHARRVDRRIESEVITEKVVPPPVPAGVINEVGVRAAIEAKRRLHEYRREQQEKEEWMKAEEAALSQQMKQVRRMYKPFNRSIGVADIPPNKRYKDARRRIKGDKQKTDAAASEETANRWYRKVKRQSHSAVGVSNYGEQILDQARREHRTKLRQKAMLHKEVEKKVQQLNLEAKRIASKTTCRYERGSYILKKAPRKSEKEKNNGQQGTSNEES